MECIYKWPFQLPDLEVSSSFVWLLSELPRLLTIQALMAIQSPKPRQVWLPIETLLVEMLAHDQASDAGFGWPAWRSFAASQGLRSISRPRANDCVRKRVGTAVIGFTREVVALLQHFSALANDEWWEAGDVSRAVPFQAELSEVQAQLLRLSAKLLGKLSTERMDLRGSAL